MNRRCDFYFELPLYIYTKKNNRNFLFEPNLIFEILRIFRSTYYTDFDIIHFLN